MIKVGIIGGAGYTAGELLRLLVWHPEAKIEFVQSKSHSNQPITNVHRDLLGDTDVVFSADYHFNIDALFLCGGHGKSVGFMADSNIPDTVKVIDLSADFRIAAPTHNFVYGSPESSYSEIAKARLIANPGCFATAIELAYLPLVNKNLLQKELNVTAITGSTGAGQAATSTSHFSWKNNNVSVYKPFEHQHLAEIKQLIFNGRADAPQVNFIPVRGNFARGIMALCTVDSDKPLAQLYELFTAYYAEHPFVTVTDQNPDVKQVVNTNKCVLHLEKHDGKLLIISVIDNLLKGASGQALQNMNIMFGLDQTMGLKIKPVAF